MKGTTTMSTNADFAMFLIGLEQKYQVAMDTILQVAAQFGYNKGKIRGYFEVRSYLAKNNLPAEQINTQMVIKWFPA
jgi:hypothetical protein